MKDKFLIIIAFSFLRFLKNVVIINYTNKIKIIAIGFLILFKNIKFKKQQTLNSFIYNLKNLKKIICKKF